MTAYAEHALALYDAPGVAIAIVEDGDAKYLGGVGVRELGKPLRMDADTLFTIASLTKAFTATAAAVAVDRGRIEWDQPVLGQLPEFRLYDPYATAQASYRDLLSHRVCVAGSFFNGLALDRQGVLALLRFEKPTDPFRAGFRYSNILYAAAGEAVARVAGTSWDEDIRHTLFEPLGMTASSSSALALAQAENHASSHVRGRDGVVRVDPFRPHGWWSMDNHAPAGAINSTARDMARWLEFQLGDGDFRGRRIVSSAALAETHRLQVPYPSKGTGSTAIAEIEGVGYALGWEIGTYGAERLVWHGGLFRGHNSLALLAPDRKLGVFVFVNSRDGENGLSSGLAQWIFDRWFDRPQRDWVAEHRVVYESRLKTKAEQERVLLLRPSKKGTPSVETRAYAGRYGAKDDWPRYTVSSRGGSLRVDLEGMAEPYFAVLTHWDRDSFLPDWNETVPAYRSADLITFTVGAHGEVRSMLFYKAGAAQPKEYLRLDPAADRVP